MELSDKMLFLGTLLGEDLDDGTLLSYLELAGEIIVAKAFPFAESKMEVPSKYARKQCEIAAYLYNKRGAEGEISHSESGISRSYESASVPDSMLKGIIPQCKVVS